MNKIYKIHQRKNIICKVKFSRQDILFLEDYLDCIPLCDKHSGYSYGEKQRPERELMTMGYECKECDKKQKKWKYPVIKLYCQLCKIFYPKEKKKGAQNVER